jgi:peptide/nickel transport system ATP-binding protein
MGWLKPKRQIRAVDGVSFSIGDTETLGLVGESGCGKSTLARVILRLIEPTGGRVLFGEDDVFSLKKKELFEFRRQAQIIFQDPQSALNPRKTIFQTLSRPFKLHHISSSDEELVNLVSRTLEQVELTPASEFLDRYPDQLSGGQRQRVVVGRAIALKPKFIVADEPVSSIDVTVRERILRLMKRIQGHMKLSYLFITHDLLVGRYFCDRIAVMYMGTICEVGDAQEIFTKPMHPYTEALSLAIPYVDFDRPKLRSSVKGELPSLVEVINGCKFHTRCPYVQAMCRDQRPMLREAAAGHLVACHFPIGGPETPTMELEENRS